MAQAKRNKSKSKSKKKQHHGKKPTGITQSLRVALEGLTRAVLMSRNEDKLAEQAIDLALEVARDTLGGHWDRWGAWEGLPLTESVIPGENPPVMALRNDMFEVWVYKEQMLDAPEDHPPIVHLSIKRRDRLPIDYNHWRVLQRIKDELMGDNIEAVQLFPCAARLVDTSNQYHLWCLAPGHIWPIKGIGTRVVSSGRIGAEHEKKAIEVGVPGVTGAKQRPQAEDMRPDDDIADNPEAASILDDAVKAVMEHNANKAGLTLVEPVATVGDIVEWTSGAGGHKKTKRGTVALVAPRDMSPTHIANYLETKEACLRFKTDTEEGTIIVRVRRTSKAGKPLPSWYYKPTAELTRIPVEQISD